MVSADASSVAKNTVVRKIFASIRNAYQTIMSIIRFPCRAILEDLI